MKVDALVVLGAKVDEQGGPGGALRRRLVRAVEAFHHESAPYVLCSGGRRWPGGVEANVMWRFLVAQGIPAERVMEEPASLSTLENAAFCSQLAIVMGWQRLGVVTCSWHLPRALRNFRRFHVDVEPFAADAPRRGFSERSIIAVSESISNLLDPVRYHVRRWS